MEVVVEGGAEGENSPEGNENAEPQTKTVTFTRHTYTVQYAGDAYFADHVFHLTDEQKKLAQYDAGIRRQRTGCDAGGGRLI